MPLAMIFIVRAPLGAVNGYLKRICVTMEALVIIGPGCSLIWITRNVIWNDAFIKKGVVIKEQYSIASR